MKVGDGNKFNLIFIKIVSNIQTIKIIAAFN